MDFEAYHIEIGANVSSPPLIFGTRCKKRICPKGCTPTISGWQLLLNLPGESNPNQKSHVAELMLLIAWRVGFTGNLVETI